MRPFFSQFQTLWYLILINNIKKEPWKYLHFAAFDVNDKENYAYDQAYATNHNVCVAQKGIFATQNGRLGQYNTFGTTELRHFEI